MDIKNIEKEPTVLVRLKNHVENYKVTSLLVIGVLVALSLRLVELKHGVEEEREEALMVDRGFVLHDESGQDQIQIAMNSVGPSLILIDPSGKKRGYLAITEEQTRIDLADSNGSKRIEFLITSEGPTVSLTKNGRGAFRLDLTNMGGGLKTLARHEKMDVRLLTFRGMEFLDSESHVRVLVRQDGAKSMVELYDPSGKRTALFQLDDKGPQLDLYDEEERARVKLGLVDGESQISILDPMGRKRTDFSLGTDGPTATVYDTQEVPMETWGLSEVGTKVKFLEYTPPVTPVVLPEEVPVVLPEETPQEIS